MTRPLSLAAVLVLAGLFFVAPAARLAGDPDTYRRAALWGVPVAAALLSALFVRRRASTSLAARGGAIVALAVLAGLLLDLAHLAYGFATGAATFTFGSQRLADARLLWISIWALPVWVAFGVFGWERALRAGVFAGLRPRLGTPAAFATAASAGVALGLPTILPGGAVPDAAFVASGLVALLAHEAVATLLFLRGGLLAAGLYRGFGLYLQAFVLDDWFSLHFPAFQVVSDTPAFYLARATAAALAALAVAALVRRRQVATP